MSSFRFPVDFEAHEQRLLNRGGKVRGLRFVGSRYDVGEETLHYHHGGKTRERLTFRVPADTEPEGTELEELLYPPANDGESQRT
jgi:hypothetical protein